MGAIFGRKILFSVLVGLVCLAGGCDSGKDARESVVLKRVVYKKAGGRELLLHVFEPAKRDSNSAFSAFLIFHGGGWFMGEPNGMYPHSRYFASRGMVAISVQYRLNEDGNRPPIEAIEDAKSAVRYVRSHAASFGIDPNKIAVGGASAGGHLAVSTALFDKFDSAGEDLQVSSRPNALVLISAAFDTTENGIGSRVLTKFSRQMAWVRGPEANEFSPLRHIRKIDASCFVIHGTADDIVPFESAERFCKVMQEAGNSCELSAMEGQGHQFSVYSEGGDNQQYEHAMGAIEEFFRSLGFLK